MTLTQLRRQGIDECKAHYTVGNVVYSAYWQQYDLVLDFVEHENGWTVTVQDCDKFGNPTRGQHVRYHQTPPYKGDKVMMNVLHYSPSVTFDTPGYSI